MDVPFDNESVEFFPSFHIFVNLNKIASVSIKIDAFVPLWQSKFDSPFGSFCYDALHYLLQVN